MIDCITHPAAVAAEARRDGEMEKEEGRRGRKRRMGDADTQVTLAISALSILPSMLQREGGALTMHAQPAYTYHALQPEL